MLNTIPQALSDLKRGKPVIVVDDANRENEGDLIIPAAKITPQIVNFMIQHARGLVCVSLPMERLQALQLPPMVVDNTDPYGTDFSVSVDARFGITTGISAQDRATTIRALLNPKTTPFDLVRPGHVFPLRAKTGGVLERAGHTEAGVDLATLAGFAPAGVCCEILNKDGSMARLPQLQRFAKQHKMKMISIEDLIAYRKQKDCLVQEVSTATLPTTTGDWRIVVFNELTNDNHHVALVKGDVYGKANVLVRVHSECLTGDVFGSLRCDCGPQLDLAMEKINQAGAGVLLYLRQEGRGIGLVNKIQAYLLQDQGLDTVEANVQLGFPPDLRDYGIGAQMLVKLGLSTIHLLTNNPKKIIGLEGHGLKITKHLPLRIKSNKYNKSYLQTKRKKLGHWLPE